MSIPVVEIVLKASLVLALAAVADLFLRRRASAAARHFAWTVTTAALLVLPLASLSLPAWSVRVPVSAPTAAAANISSPAAITAAQPIPIGAPASMAATSTAATSTRRPFDPFAFAFAIYSAGVLLFLARLVVEEVAISRFASRAIIVEDARWIEAAKRHASRLGIRRSVRLLRSEENVMPFTFGTMKPTIVLPETAARWTDDRRSAVILHELAHVARRDCLAQRVAALACALYWPHPGIWWAARRLRVEREFASDDRVLSAGTAARDYAGHLLEIAHTFRANPAPATALGMARARQLEHRLMAIIDDGRNRRGLRRTRAMIAATAALTLLVPIAALRAEIVPANALPVTPDERAAVAPMAPEPPAPEAQSRRQNHEADRDRYTSKDFTGTWEMHPTGQPGMVNVNLRTSHSQNGFSLPLSRFEGINEAGSAAVRDGRIVDGTVHLVSRRDAGTFTFDGMCRNEMCGGTYSFAPDPAFPATLAKYGVGAPTLSEQFQLALTDVGGAYIEGVKAEGYATPDVQTLVRAAEHGVSLEYVRSMAVLGYKLGTLEPLIKMRDHGVDPNYVKGMAAQGVAKLDADELVRLRDHGVDPEYVTGMRDLGYKSAGVGDLVTMRDHGVDPAYVRGLADAGYKSLDVESLVRMRDHGVDPEYARGLAGVGYKDLPVDAMIRLRDHGVDVSFIRRLQQRGGDRLSVDDLIRRRDHGDDGR